MVILLDVDVAHSCTKQEVEVQTNISHISQKTERYSGMCCYQESCVVSYHSSFYKLSGDVENEM